MTMIENPPEGKSIEDRKSARRRRHPGVRVADVHRLEDGHDSLCTRPEGATR